jgi:CubicO group peptidase (beta-lactamase class C family)
MRIRLQDLVLGVVGIGLAIVACTAGAATVPAPKPMSPAQIDGLVNEAMQAFHVPGISVGIVKDGKLIFARGYGVRTVGSNDPVDADTVFAIGSNTKAFTTAALSILVDEGKLHWEDKVIDLLPGFQLMDPWVTREFTVRDLLTHRSGLGLGAGDLMFVPETDFSRAEVIHALRYLKPVTSFRSQFAYDNLLYMVAGELIPAVTGQSWEHFVDTRLIGPLGMTGCASGPDALPASAKLATPHSMIDGTVRAVKPLEVKVAAPAGAIHCNISGMARWVSTQLAGGKMPDGGQLFSAARHEEMWTPQTLIPIGGPRAAMTRTHFEAYALGWGLNDFYGYERVSHNGGVLGMVTHVSLMPELGLGVIVLTNQEDPGPLMTIADQILESYASNERHDWVALTKTALDQAAASALAAEAEQTPKPADVQPDAATRATYVGGYADAWRGVATVSEADGALRLTFSRTKGLTGKMVAVGPELFIVNWDDRTLHADAYVRFRRDYAGAPEGFTMQAVSAMTDFSFDFHDLDFHRVKEPAAP